jgi:hypothetical protein
MTIPPTVRLEALVKLPLDILGGDEAKLDLAAIQSSLEEVVAITNTETFEPPTDGVKRFDSVDEVASEVLLRLQMLVNSLTIDFASTSSRANPLSNTISYLLTYCKLGQEMSVIDSLDV